jgi:hypothetical protein
VGLVSSVEHETCIDNADCDAGCGGQRRKRLVHCDGVVSAAGSSGDRGSEVVAVPDDVHMPVSSDGREKSHDLTWMQAHDVVMLPTPYGLVP